MEPARSLPPQPSPGNEAEGVPESGEVRKREAPLSNEPEMESDVHLAQLIVLLECLKWWWRERKDFFAAGNLSIYYPSVSSRTGRKVRKKLSFRGPDFFVVLGAKPKARRNSWVVKDEEGKYPNVIVEVLSKSTAAADRGKKKTIYQKVFKTPNYFLFDPDKLRFEGYRLSPSKRSYVPIEPDAKGRLWSDELGLAFGVHEGKLRMFTSEGELVPLPAESALAEAARAEREQARAEREQARAEREQARAEQERERAERERERAERAEAETARLAKRLHELGVDPDTLK